MLVYMALCLDVQLLKEDSIHLSLLESWAKKIKEKTVANPSEKKSNELPIPALASIAFALLAVVTGQFNPLESPRPTTPNSGRYAYQSIEDVNARLWQDPFTVVDQHKSSCSGTEKCPLDLHHEIDKLGDSVDPSHKETITVLGVMVFGGSSIDNVENRRRTRYAVLSGLAVKGYAPQDSEHIGYFNKPPINNLDKDCVYVESLPEKIPFELFNGVDDKSSVLLLWLDETAFASALTPLVTAKELVKCIKNINDILKNSAFKFIGPAGSGTLQIMINELKTSNSNESGEISEHYEKKLTIPSSFLMQRLLVIGPA